MAVQVVQRNFVTFDWPSENPDEHEVDGEVVPGGRSIMEFVHRAIQSAGFSVSPVGQHDSYGWYFEANVGEVTVWSMLQFSEPWLLISEVRQPLLRRIFRRPSDTGLTELCEAIHNLLSRSPMASNLQWFTRDEFNQKKGKNGAPTPSTS